MGSRALGLSQLLLPVVVLWGLYAGALGFELSWTDVSAIGEGTMLRPPGEIWQAFGEPLHRVQGRGASQQSDAGLHGAVEQVVDEVEHDRRGEEDREGLRDHQQGAHGVSIGQRVRAASRAGSPVGSPTLS